MSNIDFGIFKMAEDIVLPHAQKNDICSFDLWQVRQ